MVFVVVLLPALFALAALAINIAQMESANTEVQVAVDAAVRAAGKTHMLTGDHEATLAAAQEAAAKNPIGDFILPISAGDLEYGVSVRSSENDPYVFTVGPNGNAVRLTTNTLNTSGVGIDPVFPFFGSSFLIQPLRTAISTQGVIDVALVIDRSGSMAYSSSEVAVYPPNPASAPADWVFGDPVPPNARWLDLMGAVQTFIGQLNVSPSEELLALTVYNHESSKEVSLTTDYQQVVDRLTAYSLNFDSGGTNIGGGMYEGLYAVTESGLTRPHASRVIILMTDGVHNYGTSPTTADNSVANAGVTLFAITFSDEADQDLMQEVAEKCGGEHFHAIDGEQLKEAFKEIARRLPTLLTK